MIDQHAFLPSVTWVSYVGHYRRTVSESCACFDWLGNQIGL